MRFYHCFLTELPDQFVEANAAALIRWLDGWAGQNRYYRRAMIVDDVPLAVIGDAGKTRWPTLVASSVQMQLWMNNKGDAFNGRYWDTLAADQRGAADPAGDPGGDLADAFGTGPAFAWLNTNPRLAITPKSGGRAGGKGLLTTQQIVAGEIVGFRCWRVDQGFLRSVYQDDIWPPQQILQGREMEDWNQRGIHAWKDASSKPYFKYLRSYMDDSGDRGLPGMVTGSVLLWGDVVEHERGWRAEFARVRSLDWLYPDAASMGREREALQELRVRYGVTKEAQR